MARTQQLGRFDEELKNFRAQKRIAKNDLWFWYQRMNSALGLDFMDAMDDIWEIVPKHKKTIASVESCTGGLIAKLLTDRSGSSTFYTHGFVTYSPQAKMDLGVSKEIIKKYSVYSNVCATAMAENGQIRAKSNYCVATTGLAGPDGDKKTGLPAGSVWISLMCPLGNITTYHEFPGDRDQVRLFAAQTAIVQMARQIIKLDG